MQVPCNMIWQANPHIPYLTAGANLYEGTLLLVPTLGMSQNGFVKVDTSRREKARISPIPTVLAHVIASGGPCPCLYVC